MKPYNSISENAYIKAELADQDVARLTDAFRFNPHNKSLRSALGFVVRRYRRDTALTPDAVIRAQERRRATKLKRAVEIFQDALADPELADLDNELSVAALFDGVRKGEPDYPTQARLHRLLDQLSQAAEAGLNRTTPQRGRTSNFAIESLVRECAYVWSDLLRRPFTFDHHKSAPITEAGRFVHAMAAIADAGISETSLNTAIRKIIRERGAHA